MGIKEDDVELRGSQLDRMFFRMKSERETGILVLNADGIWIRANTRPAVGSGHYVEVMSNGEKRKYLNNSESDNRYQLM